METVKEKVSLNIEGMNCTACAVSVSKKLSAQGAEEVDVNFTTGEARFSMPSSVRMEALVKSVEDLGYRVVGAEGNHRERWHQSLFNRLLFCLVLTLPFWIEMLVPIPGMQNGMVQLMLCLPVFLVGFLQFGKSAYSSVKEGSPNMDVLIMTGAFAAFGYSLFLLFFEQGGAHTHLYFETTSSVISLVMLGNFLEHRTVRQTSSALRELASLQPANAVRVSLQFGKEEYVEIPIKEVKVHDMLYVATGSKIPADGLVLQGTGFTDESFITGESIPDEKSAGKKVYAGSVLKEGSLWIKVEKDPGVSTLSQIIELVKSAQSNKPKVQRLADKVSAIFVPAVIAIACITFLVCFFGFDLGQRQSLLNAIAVLVISCPCALGLATPTAVMAGVGRASKIGVMMKSGAVLEEFSNISYLIFDKTGTLTTGKFIIKNYFNPSEFSNDQLLAMLIAISKSSNHPISKSIAALSSPVENPFYFSSLKEIKGKGIEARIYDGDLLRLGSANWFKEVTGKEPMKEADLFLFNDDQLIAGVSITDEIKSDVKETISWFKERGIKSVLLSGDKREKCERVGGEIGIDEVFAEVLPQGKLDVIHQFKQKGKVAMVGDGINDAPALAAADIGVSVGEGSAAALQSAQIILLAHAGLTPLKNAYLISRKSLQTIRQNLFFSFFYNVIAIPVAAAGFLNPMLAAAAMAMSDVVVVGNSIWLKFRKL